MNIHSFSRRSRFSWHDQNYRVKRVLSRDTIAIQNEFSGETWTIALSILMEALSQGELTLLNDNDRRTTTPAGDNQYVVIDSTPLDLMIVDVSTGQTIQPDAHGKFTYLMDPVTRYVLSVSFEKEAF